MTDLVLHGFPVSTYLRTIRMACRRKGLDYTLRKLDFRSPAHAALHPWKKMPILEHGDVRLFEALAIAHYLDHLVPDVRLVPTDPVAGATALQWASAYNDYLFHPALRVARAMRKGQTIVADDATALRDGLAIVDAAMADTGWLAGPEPTLPDLVLFPMVDHMVRLQGQGALIELPHIRRAHELLSATPEAEATVPG